MATIANVLKITSDTGVSIDVPQNIWKMARRIARHDPVQELVVKAKAADEPITEDEAATILEIAQEYNEEQDALEAQLSEPAPPT